MDLDLILTEDLCGWDQENENASGKRSVISPDDEIRDMFNQLVINQEQLFSPKRPNRHRLKSSPHSRSKSFGAKSRTRIRSTQKSNNNIPRRDTKSIHDRLYKPRSTISKPKPNPSPNSAALIHPTPNSKPNLNATPKPTTKSPKIYTAKDPSSANQRLIKTYLSPMYDNKKLQRSHSNLYRRKENRPKTPRPLLLPKKQNAKPFNLQLNVENMNNHKIIATPTRDTHETNTEPVTFSAALFRSKYSPNSNSNGSVKRRSRSRRNIQKQKPEQVPNNNKTPIHAQELVLPTRIRISQQNNDNTYANHEKLNGLIMKVNDYHKKQQIKTSHKKHIQESCAPFLAPCSSIINLQEHSKKFVKSEYKQIKDQDPPLTPRSNVHHYHPRSTKRHSRDIPSISKAPIKIQCFNSSLFSETNNIKNQNPSNSISGPMQVRSSTMNDKDKGNSVDGKDKLSEDFSIGNIEQFHKQMLTKHQDLIVKTKVHKVASCGQCDKVQDEHQNLENQTLQEKLRSVITLWENQQKQLKTQQMNRANRARGFK